MHLTTSAADFSKETLVVKEEETYDAGAFGKVEAEVVKLFTFTFLPSQNQKMGSVDHKYANWTYRKPRT